PANIRCLILLVILPVAGDGQHPTAVPTRRSSDLGAARAGRVPWWRRVAPPTPERDGRSGRSARGRHTPRASGRARTPRWRRTPRSEEHTSELQSPDQLVCRLLLEKKNKKNTQRRE